ncbi:MAG: hypothetical protein JKY45_00435 [Emcibacter sp.]|nr:hypothetical protein [Emcibacter sp.]
MKNILAIVMLFLSPLSVSAQTPSPEKLMGAALEDYGKVAGAWYLNKKCGFLATPLAVEFMQNVAVVNIAMAKEVKPPKILFMIQKAAKQTAEAHECTKSSEKIVIWGVMHSRNWSKQIKKIQAQQLPKSD